MDVSHRLTIPLAAGKKPGIRSVVAFEIGLMLLQLKMGFMLSDKFIDCSDFSPTELPAIKSSHWLILSFMMVSMLKDVFIHLLFQS